jgi:threonyl-tRNA synthetase
MVIPVTDRTIEYAKRVGDALRARGLRLQLDERNEKMQAKIRDAQLQQVPYMAIVGEREAQASTVAVRHRRQGDLGSMALEAFAERVSQESRSRQAS